VTPEASSNSDQHSRHGSTSSENIGDSDSKNGSAAFPGSGDSDEFAKDDYGSFNGYDSGENDGNIDGKRYDDDQDLVGDAVQQEVERAVMDACP